MMLLGNCQLVSHLNGFDLASGRHADLDSSPAHVLLCLSGCRWSWMDGCLMSSGREGCRLPGPTS
jgi:hypothetical protein